MAWSEMVRVIRVKLPGKQKNGFRFSVKRGRHRLWMACTSLAAKVKAQAAAKPAARSLPRGCSAATFQSTVLSAVGKRRAQKRLDKTTQQRRGWLKWEHASYERCRRFPILAEWRPRIIVCTSKAKHIQRLKSTLRCHCTGNLVSDRDSKKTPGAPGAPKEDPKRCIA